MLIALALAAQTVPGPPGDDEAAVPRVTQPRPCVRKDDEIVVCGGGGTSDRLMPLPEPGTLVLFKPAAVRISPNKSAAMHAASSSNPNVPEPRMMLDFTVRF